MARLDTPICDFGWKAPDFTLATPDGREVTFSNNLGDKGLMVMFICNHCPYVKAITARLKSDTDKLMAQGVNVIAVMSNDYIDYPDDSPEKMLEFSLAHGFGFPYVVDEDQSVGKAFGAVCTPDFFGFNAKGELQYRGRLDSAPMGASASQIEGRVTELVNAMEQIAATGQGPKSQIPSMGCSIKWSR